MIELPEEKPRVLLTSALEKQPEIDVIEEKKRVIIQDVRSDDIMEEGKRYFVVTPDGTVYAGTILSLNYLVESDKLVHYRIIILDYDETFVTSHFVTKRLVCEFLNRHFARPIFFVQCHNTNAIDITLYPHRFIEDSTLCMTGDFYEHLENILSSEFGLSNIRYNNARLCFWHNLIVKGD